MWVSRGPVGSRMWNGFDMAQGVSIIANSHFRAGTTLAKSKYKYL